MKGKLKATVPKGEISIGKAASGAEKASGEINLQKAIKKVK